MLASTSPKLNWKGRLMISLELNSASLAKVANIVKNTAGMLMVWDVERYEYDTWDDWLLDDSVALVDLLGARAPRLILLRLEKLVEFRTSSSAVIASEGLSKRIHATAILFQERSNSAFRNSLFIIML